MTSQKLGGESFSAVPDVNGTSLVLAGTTIPYHGVDRSNHTISYVSATRTLTLTANSGNFSYWYNGVLITTNSPTASLVHSATAGNYYLYFTDTSGVITAGASYPGTNLTRVLICSIYWDGTKGTVWDDRHNFDFPTSVHSYSHNSIGCSLDSGVTLGGYTMQNGVANSAVTYALSTGVVADEDVRVTIQAQASGGPYSCWYLNGSTPGWAFTDTLALPYLYGTYIQYNNGTALTDLATGQYVNYWIYGATILNTPQTFAVVGQVLWTDLASALAETYTTLILTGMPSREILPLYRVTYRADAAYSTTGHAAIYAATALNIHNGALLDMSPLENTQFLNFKVLTLPQPPTPAVGDFTAYATSQAGKNMLNVITSDSIATQLQPALFGNNVIMLLSGTGTTLPINFGASFTATNSGTAAAQTTPTVAGANAVTQMKRTSFNTGSTATGSSGLVTSSPVAWRGNAAGLGGFYFFARFALETYLASERIFLGLTAANTSLAANPSTRANSIGIGKDSADTTLQIISVTSAGVATKTNTGVTPSVTQILDFTMFCHPNDNKVTVLLVDPISNTVLLANTELASANLPLNTVFLYMLAQIQSTSGTTAETLSVNRLYLETET